MWTLCICARLYMCLWCSGATRGCVWCMGLVQRAWTGGGVCGLPGRSAAGPAEEGCPLLSDTVTAPGMALKCITLTVTCYLKHNNKSDPNHFQTMRYRRNRALISVDTSKITKIMLNGYIMRKRHQLHWIGWTCETLETHKNTGRPCKRFAEMAEFYFQDLFSGSSAAVSIVFEMVQIVWIITKQLANLLTRSLILIWLISEWIDPNRRPTVFFCIIS